jgi:hypothetical protein
MGTGKTIVNLAPEAIAWQFIQGEHTNITCIENGVLPGSEVIGYGYNFMNLCFYIEYSREDDLVVTVNPIMHDDNAPDWTKVP